MVGYALYILLTYMDVGPKSAMTALYAIGVLQTFVFNKKWSFRFAGAPKPALVRYIIAYAAGYAVNFLALVILVDRIGLNHQVIQAVLILFVAVLMFMAQRYWVFPHSFRSDAA